MRPFTIKPPNCFDCGINRVNFPARPDPRSRAEEPRRPTFIIEGGAAELSLLTSGVDAVLHRFREHHMLGNADGG